MSANQWETVTKSKKQRNLEKKIENKQMNSKEDASAEEYLKYYAAKYEESRKVAERIGDSASVAVQQQAKAKSPRKVSKAKQQQQVQQQQEQQEAKKLQQQKAALKPKSLESAIRNLKLEDFATQLQQLQISCPGSELLWLKGIASFINLSIPFECDPIFAGKPIHYPTSLLQRDVKVAIVEFLHSMGDANLEYFYHQLIDGMAVELSKNLTIVGYKILLQLTGEKWPHLCSKNMAKTAVLRNSYQNRKNICLTILWAIGQGGYQKLNEGVKVWQNLMLPTLELRSYSKFVVEYFAKILSVSVDQSLTLDQNEFFTTYKALRLHYPNIPRVLQVSLSKSAEIFLQKYIAISSKHSHIFLTLFRDMQDSVINRVELEGCLSCLLLNTDCFKVWKMNYKRQLRSSILLLKKIEEEKDGKASVLYTSKPFRNLLNDIEHLSKMVNQAKRHDYQWVEFYDTLQHVQEKSSHKKRQSAGESSKKCGCCKWVWGSLFLIILIAGALIYDTQTNGKGVFAKSASGKVLKDAGLLPYAEKAWYTTMGASARGYKWAEKHVPPYAKPALELTTNLFKLGRNAACNIFSATRDYVNSKLPVAAEFLEQYLPGLPKKIEHFSVAVKDVVVDLFVKTSSFVRTQVLVGRLSPENLGKALNQTQNVALEYYNLFHKKVDAYAKLK